VILIAIALGWDMMMTNNDSNKHQAADVPLQQLMKVPSRLIATPDSNMRPTEQMRERKPMVA
jgi:hypothetical protein